MLREAEKEIASGKTSLSMAPALAQLQMQLAEEQLEEAKAEVTDGKAQLEEAKQQLAEYFAGQRQAFDLPLRMQGTPFQQKVWAALREIPYGETRSYGQIAAQVGNPKAGRAVGMANNRNPIAIIVPCHRVIGANGSLTGYAGGLSVKQELLALERRTRQR